MSRFEIQDLRSGILRESLCKVQSLSLTDSSPPFNSFLLIFRGNFVIDELYLRQHGFTDQDIAKFSMGGEQVKFEELAEDLYISQELRDKIKKSRGGK